MLTIAFNGQETVLVEGTTISQFITKKGLNPKSIVVEYNYEIVKEAAWSEIELKTKDTLEILSFVGGG